MSTNENIIWMRLLAELSTRADAVGSAKSPTRRACEPERKWERGEEGVGKNI